MSCLVQATAFTALDLDCLVLVLVLDRFLLISTFSVV